MELTAPLIGISRHRLATDGVGVTTLVAFHGCPLRCKYCLNSQCQEPDGVWRQMDVAELLDFVMLDNLYFLATGGGVTFGGGEPCLRSEFIEAFCQKALREWRITLETSLHVKREHLQRLLPWVQEYIIDVKDLNPLIYKKYTNRSLRSTLNNLRWLLSHDGMAERIVVRVPHIPNHNTAADTAATIETLHDMGITRIDEFDYILPEEIKKSKR
ncbi:MAG: radical SAM protein [Muribaculaceae bacterium]|nr:radical SAM protein [Muribaculaceae bacterium]